MTNTILLDCVADYAIERRITAGSEYQLGRSVRLFAEWLQRDALPTDLTDRTVSSWLRDLETTHAQRTVAGHRGNLLMVWRFAAGRSLCEYPGKVRREPKPRPTPIAWTTEELHRVLAACDQLTRTSRHGVDLRVYFTAITRAAYETGLRRSDLWRLRRSQIRPDGRIVGLRQHKTGNPITPQLQPETLALIDNLNGDPPLNWTGSDSVFYHWWAKIIRAANVRSGALQQLRRTGATYIARDAGEDEATAYLGHTTTEMRRHYIDRSISTPHAPQPPRLQYSGANAMKRTAIIALALLVVCGCTKQPSPINQSVTKEQSATQQPRLTDDQLFRLFSTTWVLDYDATIAYPSNASSDQEALKGMLWSNTIQSPVTVHFVDAGI